MKNILLVVLTFAVVSGCASQANLEFSLEPWIGHNINGLVEHWGTPSKVRDSVNGSLSYTWLFDDGITNSPIEGTVNAVAIYCRVIVDVAENKTIQSWQLEGNDCKA